MKKSKKIIWPFGCGYILCLSLMTLLCLVGCPAAFVYTLCGQENNGSLILLQRDTPANRIIEALIYLVAGLLIFYFEVFRFFYHDKIIFTDDSIIKDKRKVGFNNTLPAINLKCNEIISANIQVGLYSYLILETLNKKYKIFITSFSRKQILKIVTMINERGGQIDVAQINRFLKEEYLFGKRKNKKKTTQ